MRQTAVLYSCNLALCRQHAKQISHDLNKIGITLDVKIDNTLSPDPPGKTGLK